MIVNILKRRQVVEARGEAQAIYYSLANYRSEKALHVLNSAAISARLQEDLGCSSKAKSRC